MTSKYFIEYFLDHLNYFRTPVPFCRFHVFSSILTVTDLFACAGTRVIYLQNDIWRQCITISKYQFRGELFATYFVVALPRISMKLALNKDNIAHLTMHWASHSIMISGNDSNQYGYVIRWTNICSKSNELWQSYTDFHMAECAELISCLLQILAVFTTDYCVNQSETFGSSSECFC